MTTIDTTDARIEEASHAIINLLTTKHFKDDRMTFVQVPSQLDMTLHAKVVTNASAEITQEILAHIGRGYLLNDYTSDEQKTHVRERLIAKAQMSVGGKAGVDLYHNRKVSSVLNNYTFRKGWYEASVESGEWWLRDSDKSLLIAYFVEVTDNRVIPIGSTQGCDFLKPIADAYTNAPALRAILDGFVIARTAEAVSLLKANWDAVLKLADELDRRPVLSLHDVLQLLAGFPNIMGGIERDEI